MPGGLGDPSYAGPPTPFSLPVTVCIHLFVLCVPNYTGNLWVETGFWIDCLAWPRGSSVGAGQVALGSWGGQDLSASAGVGGGFKPTVLSLSSSWF